MKIFFGTSTSQFKKYHKYYEAIRSAIIDEGHVITRDWLGKYREELLEKKKWSGKNKEGWYGDAISSLYNSDALVIDDTVSSFSNGHLMTLMLQRKRPVLVLRIKEKKKTGFPVTFLQGFESEYVEVCEYDLENISEVIRRFSNKFEDHYKRHRFHLVIDEVEKNYIEWASHEKDVSKTEIIREGIRKQLEDDEGYREYLTE